MQKLNSATVLNITGMAGTWLFFISEKNHNSLVDNNYNIYYFIKTRYINLIGNPVKFGSGPAAVNGDSFF